MEATLPLQRHRLRADVVVKQIMRSFRAYLKGQFKYLYSKQQYYWVPKTLREKTRLFYQETYGGISTEQYLGDENALLLLIHSTKKKKFLKSCSTNQAAGVTGVMRLFKDVFGPKPNKRNLRKFFKLDVIQKLWFGSMGYARS